MTSDHDESYQSWVARRRGEQPGGGLTDRVMRAVFEVEQRRAASRMARIAHWIDRSRTRRRLACSAALLVGSLPLVYLTYISQVFPA